MDDMRAAVKKTSKLAERQRSSLLSHTFPSFYACYLLKSIQSPTSKATYIGSTPNPPRRIRQHNGELTQGAWKTKRGRPWVMQMIVHGFPSKLAALQFEWAWQHPHLSRHIRDENGRVFTSSGRGLNQNILALRFMISIHPYNLWPLHVKVFTPQALKLWEGLSNVGKTVKGKGKEKVNSVQSPALPPGFTYSVELEGVDGKSTGGSGRTKPIEVQDEQFTTAYLKKDLDLLASKNSLKCTVCQESLTGYTSDPLTHSLCPHLSCNATAHLLCLSKHLLSQSESSSLVPRGGSCPSCSNYILWGDVVKGCYRRAAGGAVSVEEDEKALDDMYNSDSLEEPSEVTGRKGKGKAKRVISPRKQRERGQMERSSSSSLGEQFDFQEVEEQQYSDDLGIGTSRRGATRSPSKLKIGKVQLTIPTPLTPSATSRARKPKATSSSPSTPKKRSKAVQARDSSEGELFDFDDVERLSFSDDEGPKRRVGRPRKRLAVEQVVPGPSPQPTGAVKRAPSWKDRGPTSPVARSVTKRTFIGGKTLNDPSIPLKPPQLMIQPLFESDGEDTEMDSPDRLARSMSSLSVTSPSS